MKYYVISDTHFNHDPIIGFCNRPENHEELMLRNILVDVPVDACLIHLGDFALSHEAEACVRLCQHCVGRKILVMGNHDSKSASWYMEHGWDFACDAFQLKYAGKIIHFSHKPSAWDGVWDINVHGHLHNLGHRDDEFKDLKQWHRLYSPELMNYQPVRLDTFIQDKRYVK